MNKRLKILLGMMFVFCGVLCINHIVLADVSGSDLTNLFDGKNGVNTTDGENLMTNIIGTILSVVRIVAIGIAIIMITILGMKYMAAAPSEKANIKSQLITFTVGAVVVIATTSILDMIKNAVAAITSTT